METETVAPEGLLTGAEVARRLRVVENPDEKAGTDGALDAHLPLDLLEPDDALPP